MKQEFRTWEELKTDKDREAMLAFTDQFVFCPQQFISTDVLSEIAGVSLNLTVSRGTPNRQLVIRDVLVTVTNFHAVAPTLIPGAAYVNKPVIGFDLSSRRLKLPWEFHPKCMANLESKEVRDFNSVEVVVTGQETEAYLLKLMTLDKGIYEFTVDIVLQEGSDEPIIIRLTEQPVMIGFFQYANKETNSDFAFLRQRFEDKGGMGQFFERMLRGDRLDE